ncbi:hypothetical protein [Streptomyces silvensis]|uniref:Uncharacterized protein n=1 Tax=Streptomyces silvensis TaxID=1765722 RepID=A0A0W7XBH7_9ACTN|nr:hypothetical protein [Streptomyces silvensis]KUF20155.1 hypothetical protein AT728_40255 [Streptomyces silvensis]
MSAPAAPPRPAGCVSYGHTHQRGGCGAAGGRAVRLLTITFAERRTQRLALCDLHADGVYEDVADPLLAYLRCTGVTEVPIRAAAEQ